MTTIAAVGIGMSVVGGVTSMFGASDKADAQQQVLQLQMQQEAERKKAMELNARRESLEAIRKGQTARALALTNATNQGAGGGSGIQGGYGQIAGATGTRLAGINQNLDIGRNMFNLNQAITGQQMQIADAESMMGFGAGLSSMGGALVNNMGAIGRIGGGFGGGANSGMNFGFSNPNGGGGIIGVGPYG